jgi:hypothetical protein
VCGGGSLLLLVRLYTLPECFVTLALIFGLLLLLLKDGGCFCGGSGGFRRLMPLVGQCAAYRGQRREDGKQYFRVDRFQHRVSD